MMKKFGLVSNLLIFLVVSISVCVRPANLFAIQKPGFVVSEFDDQNEGNPYHEIEEAASSSSAGLDSDGLERTPQHFPNELESTEWTTLGADSKAFMGMQ